MVGYPLCHFNPRSLSSESMECLLKAKREREQRQTVGTAGVTGGFTVTRHQTDKLYKLRLRNVQQAPRPQRPGEHRDIKPGESLQPASTGDNMAA